MNRSLIAMYSAIICSTIWQANGDKTNSIGWLVIAFVLGIISAIQGLNK